MAGPARRTFVISGTSAMVAGKSAIAQPRDALQTWLEGHVSPIRNIDATDEDIRDLEPLGDAIGAALGIAEDTVKMHVKNVLEKLGVNDRTEAVTVALRRGILHL